MVAIAILDLGRVCKRRMEDPGGDMLRRLLYPIPAPFPKQRLEDSKRPTNRLQFV